MPATHSSDLNKRCGALTLVIAAACAPSLLAYNQAPSPTLWNQALALALWGAFVAASGRMVWARGTAPLLGALALLGAAVLWSWGPGGLPGSLALSGLGLLAAAAVLLCAGAGSGAGAGAGAGTKDTRPFEYFCWAWLVAGLANVAVAGVQVFAPSWPDGVWIAASTIEGRAVGNLRQPNHLSSLLLWSCVAVVALLELRRLALAVAVLAQAALVFAVVLTASRTGLLSVLLLALWGLVDGRLQRSTRALLLAAPALYGAAWWLMAQWAAAAQHSFGGAQRLAESDISGSRFGIWANTLDLIRAQPWGGVGWGEFNFAWTLSPFPQRPTAFFDHTHNLPLQLAVELGLPLAALVMALLLWGLARGLWLAWRTNGADSEFERRSDSGQVGAADDSTTRRCAMVMVLMIALHSLLEYPLWYAYFLLPTAWVWGWALRDRDIHAIDAINAHAARRGPMLMWAGMALVAGAAVLVWDYSRVVAIYTATPGAPPLAQRIEAGQHSLFFAHHADYAAVTVEGGRAPAPPEFDRATHYLLDSRLMMAWARSLAAAGQTDAARHLAARLREFKRVDADEMFEDCTPASAATTASAPASAPGTRNPSFACEAPAQPQRWQSYLPTR